MNKIKNFELGTILTMITGYSCVDDFNKVWNLVWYVCDNNKIGPIGIGMVKDEVKSHLLTIHPELKSISYQKGKKIDEFVSQQVEKFGSVLPVTKLGVEIPEKYRIKISKTSAEKFVDNIENMKSPHLRNCGSLSEREGAIEDYSTYQEPRDLENYKSFLNSSAYDEVREVKTELDNPLTLEKLRKRNVEHYN